ncbi:uncharacterized protein YueI [Weissella uvarum]|uniref:YueI family protein n=1 Tax=Weissella uvarum TaxID=1479233 RepID=UPI001961D32D|nr:YueI family protein [Weissella uvarum]MBM7616509.1 uncharacterized protein YueI [Weissella uvarum]MCM0595030.1 YueI family protein [Weissella uvarum]
MAEIDPHLQNAMYGTPEINPDEKHYYLGTFKERVYATQQIKTIDQTDLILAWKNEIKRHPAGLLLLNGRVEMTQLNAYMQLAKQQDIEFRLVNDPVLMKSPLGVVYTASQAIEGGPVAIEDTVTPVVTEQNQAEAKKPWYKRLF